MFYEIREGSNRYKYFNGEETFLGYEKSVCPACGRTVCAPKYSAETPVFMLDGGKKYPDFFHAYTRGSIISKRALEAFLEAGATGIEYSPVIIANAEEETPEYVWLKPQGFIDIDYTASGIKKKNFCAECGQFELNRLRPCPVKMDPASWNELDVCRLGLYPHRLIVTEKVLAAAKKAGLKGMTYAEESDILYALKSKRL
jgi:ribosomal protein S27AE